MNIFEMAQIPLNKAIETMELDAGAAAIIAVTERTLGVSIPVKMDDGTTKVFTGYRSQHSTILGPAKGGVGNCCRAGLRQCRQLDCQAVL